MDPVMAGVAAILRAYSVGRGDPNGWRLVDVAAAADGKVSAGAVHDLTKPGHAAPKSIRVIDRVLNVFGFELAIRKIPDRPANRIEPMVNVERR